MGRSVMMDSPNPATTDSWFYLLNGLSNILTSEKHSDNGLQAYLMLLSLWMLREYLASSVSYACAGGSCRLFSPPFLTFLLCTFSPSLVSFRLLVAIFRSTGHDLSLCFDFRGPLFRFFHISFRVWYPSPFFHLAFDSRNFAGSLLWLFFFHFFTSL